MIRDVNANIYGPSEDWINPFGDYGDTDGSWGQGSWHNTHWIYDPVNDTGQEYNYPPEPSIALWGIRNDFSASTKAITDVKFSKENGEVYAQSFETTYTENTEKASSVVAFIAKGYGGYDEPPVQWVSPIAQWAYDVKANDEELKPSTRLPDNDFVGAPTIYGTSIPITHINRKNFVVVPYVTLAAKNINTGETFVYSTNYTLEDAYTMMSQAGESTDIYPIGISFVPYIGQEVPNENNPRQLLNYSWVSGDRFWLLSDTLNNLTLTPDLKTYYGTHEIPAISPRRNVIDPDSPSIYSQAPFTGYNSFGNENWPIQQGISDRQLDKIPPIGGFETVNINSTFESFLEDGEVFQVNHHLNTSDQIFDDVEYRWGDPTWYYKISNNTYTPLQPALNIHDKELGIFPSLHIIDDKGNSKAEAYYRALLHECASVGWWFAINADDVITQPTGKRVSDLYLPLMEDSGITNGLYVTGNDLLNEDQADWGDTRDIDYNPTPYPDITPDGRSGDWTYSLRNFDLNTQKYHVLDTTKYGLIRAIIQGTHTVHDPVSGEDKQVANLADYGGVNAGDWITCLFWYPFNIPTRTNSAEQVMAGPLYLGASAPLWNEATLSNTYDLGVYDIGDSTLAYHDFRGYNYCKIYLRLPFYGDYELDLHRYYGGPINVKAIIDFSSAHGTYMIFSRFQQNWYLFDTVDFKVGVQLPMDSIGMGTYQNQMHVAEKQLFNSKLALAGSVATTLVGAGLGAAIAGGTAAVEAAGTAQKLALGGGAGIIGSLNKMADAKYALEHTSPSPGKCLPASPFCAAIQDLEARIMFVYPKCAEGYGKDQNGYNLSEYGRNTGFACIRQGTLTSLGVTGLTVCSNIRFNTHTQTITTQEMTLIENAVKAGIII